MTSFINLFFNLFHMLWNTLFSKTFELFGYSVSVGSVLLAFVIIAMFCSIFFKGAKG